ncbi:hypothetical protein F2Q70_00011448 [Brassica cretica]|uniref:Uncharacterized protein n=1 Tax=Brassica cretica TaxID=69181 RepID=A0A8S9M5D6_BRACR|nr:hypothetical protein F2Q70_00011448 [Brassica cretica]
MRTSKQREPRPQSKGSRNLKGRDGFPRLVVSENSPAQDCNIKENRAVRIH